jgi:nucleoside-diphosphate-sugar epimerase
MKKILILGGNGYLGCALQDYLQSLNILTENVDLCWHGKVYENTLVKDYGSITKEYLNNFSHVILLAAHSTVHMCSSNLKDCFKNNVSNFVSLVENLNETQTLIYSSTAAVYGSNDSLVDENYPLTDALNFYDYTKICNEQIANLYPTKQIVGIRYGSVGGFSKNFRRENLINSLSANAFKNKKITVSNPEKMRSILGIKDFCKAMVAIIDGGKPKNKVYNWTSVNSKIIDFGEKIKSITNCDLKIDESFNTNYSFNCSNKLFESHYNFKFVDTIETMYEDIVSNYDNILYDVKREKKDYDFK